MGAVIEGGEIRVVGVIEGGGVGITGLGREVMEGVGGGAGLVIMERLLRLVTGGIGGEREELMLIINLTVVKPLCVFK